MENKLIYNYLFILKSLVQYLPSRVIIVLNSFFIIPLLAYKLNQSEISVFLIAINILNLICTCSYDWVAKAVLRFYEKYRIKNELDSFFSTVFWIAIAVYLIIIAVFFAFKDFVTAKFSIETLTFALVILLVIPCGIRQFLYQLLRIKNRYWLYTFSIIAYQILFLLGFCYIFKLIQGADSAIITMLIAIAAIDVYITATIPLNYSVNKGIDTKILKEILKYSLPQIITNSAYWSILHISKFIFQALNQYVNTSILGVALTLTSNTIQPLASLFIFVNFPILIKNFERKYASFGEFSTNLLQLYMYLLIPFVFCLSAFAGDITRLFFPGRYSMVALIIPFFALTSFLHEFVKLVNIKYHLNNKTYIEMFIIISVFLLTIGFNIGATIKYQVIGAAAAILITELILAVIHLFVRFKSFNYLEYKKIFRTALYTLINCTICYFICTLALQGNYIAMRFARILIFLAMSYFFNYSFRNKILLG